MTQRLSVLLVDDSSTARMSLEAILSDDFDVTVCGSGAEALVKLSQGTFNLLLTDHQMPEMTGLELIRHPDVAAKGLPCVLMTGAPEEVSAPDELTVISKTTAPARLIRLLSVLAKSKAT